MTLQKKKLLKSLLKQFKLEQSKSTITIGTKLKVKVDGNVYPAVITGFNNPLITKLIYSADVMYNTFTRHNMGIAISQIVQMDGVKK